MKKHRQTYHAPDRGTAGASDDYSAAACQVKVPLVRMTKRGDISNGRKVLIYVISFVLALAVGALLLVIIGKNPFTAYYTIVKGAFGSGTAVRETIRLTIPLLITGIGIALAFKMKFWNIGGEGQILVGGIASTALVIYTRPDAMPEWVLLLLMFIVAVIAGSLYAAIPAFFKTKWGTNETLFTLMLNYIAISFVLFLRNQNTWKQKGSTFPIIQDISDRAKLPTLFGVHIGWVVALAIAVLAYIYLKKTKHGYEISVVGDSLNTARYAGMNTRKIQIRTLAISGALCGLVGYLQVAGADGMLSEHTAGGVGFTAITVAWLSKLNPFFMIPVSVFIALLKKGSLAVQSQMGIPASAADVLTGLILFFMLANDFFIEYRLVFRKRKIKGV